MGEPPIVVRQNRRAERTFANILAATERSLLSDGAERISIIDICKDANLSRGTFYRYFSCQDDLLDVYSRHKREEFYSSMVAATSPHDDPDSRFRALVDFLESYAAQGQATHLLRVAPEYSLRFYQRIFNDSRVRIEEILRDVFDAWDERFSIRVDRDLVSEFLIRYILSEQLVPPDHPGDGVERVEQLIRVLINAARLERFD